MPHLFTSESVTEGHPDKVCDKFSDAVLDAVLKQDARGRVACEAAVKTQWAAVFGEITSSAHLAIDEIVLGVMQDIGYTDKTLGFDVKNVEIDMHLERQSPDIAQGVDRGDRLAQGAGDQGIMFGYASNETPELMPLPISLAHRLSKRLTQVRKEGTLPYLRPDGKSQVTVEYDDRGNPKRLDAVVISSHHIEAAPLEMLQADIRKHVIEGICGEWMDDQTKIHINPTGRFVVGGPKGDSGLTGRKIIVDTYGGMGRHGGGAFSGKDPSKVDRSAAYAARHAAKNIVAANLARKCEIQLGYAIGVAEPVSINVNTFGTSKLTDPELEEAVRKTFDFRPGAIVDQLALLKPQYYDLAAYGHMGREDLGVAWEKKDRVDALLRQLTLD